MAFGWIKLYRSLMYNDLWQYKPFSRGQAWVDLLLLAAHKDEEFYFNNKIFRLNKGEILTSKRKLSNRWGWSITKITRFLFELESVGMLSQKSDTKKTIIKITKYDNYQAFDGIQVTEKRTQKITSKEHKSNTERTPKETYNNNNNNKNNKNKIKNTRKEKNTRPSADFSPSEIFPSEQDLEYEEMCKRLDKIKRGKRNEHL